MRGVRRAPLSFYVFTGGDNLENKYIEAGKIINTHGIKGEVKIDPWTDTPQFLLQLKSFHIDGRDYKVNSSRVHQRFVIASLEGIGSINEAEHYKDKIIYISRDEVNLDEGQYFLTDLIGFTALSDSDGSVLGNVTDILSLPAGEICVINGTREILVPLRPEFITERNMEEKILKIHLLEGM